ncbi:TagA domain-containing protein [Photobacterium damselae]|uniref:TagA domain-containing protein n=1 Tax=Photobacterium damselae TaxID=38293 RepID=UPI001F2032C3|nr:TagA domain-containing protein [Photobacterium damselae]UKA08931.1 hypothetical protein IHC91_07770 [Photobacterium damselae subsp. damselae]
MEPFKRLNPYMGNRLSTVANFDDYKLEGANYIEKLFDNYKVVTIATLNNIYWVSDFELPAANVAGKDSVIILASHSPNPSYYEVAGVKKALNNGETVYLKSDGDEWQEVPESEATTPNQALLKPEKFGVPVTTLVGYYDPEQKLQSYIYPALHGSRGYTYADNSESITRKSCYLNIELENGNTLKYLLDSARLSASFMNKFHVNIAESDNPVSAKPLFVITIR